MKTFLKMLQPPGIRFISSEFIQGAVFIHAVTSKSHSCCPSCFRKSKKIHSYKNRKIRDLPIGIFSGIINLKFRKFHCTNPDCKQKIFTERLDEIPSYSRYSGRIRQIISSIAIETSANKTRHICKQLHIPVSSSSVLRMVHSLKIDTKSPVTVLGIDDWAIRKGMNYGTILIDMETNAVIDLLQGRDGAELKPFLSNHPEIKHVCRDRSSSYATAVKEILPDAVQVADRFHLVKNVSDCIYEVLKSNYKIIRKVFEPEQNSKTQSLARNMSDSKPEKSKPREDYYAEIFLKVKEMRSKKKGYKTIAKQLKISRNTAKRYDFRDSPVVKSCSYQNNYHLYMDQIQKMYADGCRNSLIFKEIKKQGFSGSSTSLNLFINKNLGPKPKSNNTSYAGNNFSLSARKISIFLGMKNFKRIKSDLERELMRQLLRKSSLVRKLRKVYIRFKEILKKASANRLQEWLHQVISLDIKQMSRLANGIKQDIDAVSNAISSSWSSGRVEGKINKLKTLKRQMYGRASLDLLRRKMIFSITG